MRNAVFTACACAALGACATAGPGPAPAPGDPNEAILSHFTTDNVGGVLSDMGATWQTMTAQNGQPYIEASLGGALNLVIVPTACETPGFVNCVGLNIVSVLKGAAFNPQTVTAFNQRYPFSTAGLWIDGTDAYISRYEICDYGIPRGNVAVSIRNLGILANRFRDELATSKKTVSLQGYPEDLAARYLNEKNLEALGGAPAQAALARHAAGVEDSLELVRALVERDAAPSNKVKNITAQ
ncbi:MAG: hypothetical protein GC153_06845 [Alphaproteobacteria bacterium]|nr:hypothetical protein [Alphaproteobacteria bacterium]